MAKRTTPSPAQLREADEPDELRNPVPWPIALVSIAFVLWGAWYYFQNVGYPISAGDRRSAIVALAPDSAGIDGEAIYLANCSACHQSTGLGLSGVFPPLVQSRWVLENDARLIQILLHGINGVIEVRGMQYQGLMPAFSQLSNEELAAVLTHIRNSWGNAAPPLTADQIAVQREASSARSGPWGGGAELDQAFPPADGG